MITTLLHRFFGFGKIPAGEWSALQSEGIMAAFEGVSGTLTYKNYRAPGKIFFRKRRWFIGSMVITEQRFVAYAFSRRLLNAPMNNHSPSKWDISVEAGSRLCLACDASNLTPDQSGGLEFRFTIPDPEKVARFLEKDFAYNAMQRNAKKEGAR